MLRHYKGRGAAGGCDSGHLWLVGGCF
jgi:hypothetical protein